MISELPLKSIFLTYIGDNPVSSDWLVKMKDLIKVFPSLKKFDENEVVIISAWVLS